MIYSLSVSSLVEETKKDGFVDVTQAYNKIINSIREAEEAANMADKAASDALKVQLVLDHVDSQSGKRMKIQKYIYYIYIVLYLLLAERGEPGLGSTC